MMKEKRYCFFQIDENQCQKYFEAKDLDLYDCKVYPAYIHQCGKIQIQTHENTLHEVESEIHKHFFKLLFIHGYFSK